MDAAIDDIAFGARLVSFGVDDPAKMDAGDVVIIDDRACGAKLANRGDDDTVNNDDID